jgi:hypothetical protein
MFNKVGEFHSEVYIFRERIMKKLMLIAALGVVMLAVSDQVISLPAANIRLAAAIAALDKPPTGAILVKKNARDLALTRFNSACFVVVDAQAKLNKSPTSLPLKAALDNANARKLTALSALQCAEKEFADVMKPLTDERAAAEREAAAAAEQARLAEQSRIAEQARVAAAAREEAAGIVRLYNRTSMAVGFEDDNIIPGKYALHSPNRKKGLWLTVSGISKRCQLPEGASGDYSIYDDGIYQGRGESQKGVFVAPWEDKARSR